MLRKMTACLLVLATLGSGAALAAGTDPSIHEIYQATQSGRLAQAEQMVSQVLQDHPGSAQAHYVAAEVYARAGDFPTARRQLTAAESLAPGLPFATPQSAAALRAELAQGRFLPRVTQPGYPPYAPQGRPRSGVPWGLALVILTGIVVVWALARRRMQPVYPPYPPPPMGGVGPMGVGGGVVPPYPYGGAPGAGPGLLSSLGTGLAVGAGVAAGEELVRHDGSGSGGPGVGADDDFGTGGDLGGGGGDWS